jgi:glycosyltransferase involved in cell wall biosynthesis
VGDAVRCTWLSNAPWSPTGYGSQTRLFLPRLKAAGHDPACLAFYGLEGGPLTWSGIRVYPRYRHQYGLDVAEGHTLHHRAQVMLSLVDAWIFEPALLQRVRWVPWYPVDCEPMPEPVRSALTHAYERITMSRFGERMTAAAGLDSTYIPHGFDPAVFHPMDKAECRRRLDWPQDTFIAAMVAANKGIPSRKAFPQQFEAFSLLAAQHPDVRLYVHSNSGAEGIKGDYNLIEMAQAFGIADRTMFPDSYEYLLGYPDEYVATLYNAADVLLHVSMGEGFGIPIIEAQACGTKVIVGEWTAMTELLRGGWYVHKEEAERFFMPIGSYQWLPHPAAIADRLEYAYRSKAEDDSAKEHAADISRWIGKDYAVDVVMERHWTPFLERLERRLMEENRLHSANGNGVAPRLVGAHA